MILFYVVRAFVWHVLLAVLCIMLGASALGFGIVVLVLKWKRG
jgi:hypothetical protein